MKLFKRQTFSIYIYTYSHRNLSKRQKTLKVLYLVTFYSNYTRVLTFFRIFVVRGNERPAFVYILTRLRRRFFRTSATAGSRAGAIPCGIVLFKKKNFSEFLPSQVRGRARSRAGLWRVSLWRPPPRPVSGSVFRRAHEVSASAELFPTKKKEILTSQ